MARSTSDVAKEAETAVEGVEEMLRQSADGVSLRDHQRDGLLFMLECQLEGRGCILADEMGLGKTCQAVGALLCLSRRRPAAKHLVVCPLSVLDHWSHELDRFGVGLSSQSYRGTREERLDLQHSLRASTTWNVLLTTYELFLRDKEFFGEFAWSAFVIDEAHRLKNEGSLIHQSVLEVGHEWPLLLTGTPVQNNLQELYALLSIAAPRLYSPSQKDAFLAKDVKTALTSVMLRRTKDEIALDIPHKSEVVLFHGLTALQKRLYKAILVKNHALFDVGGEATSGGHQSLMNALVQLRKCVDHPYLFDGVEPEPFEEGEHLVEASGKLMALDRLLLSLRRNGHRVLVFSQMTRMLDVLQDYLAFRGMSYERLDGSVRAEERVAAVRGFNEQTDTFAFLLSTKAGGVGLTLTAADTAIFVDSDFNPQNDLQAAARAHRIGQTRPVKIIRLVGKNTVEEVILARAARKLELTESVMSAANGDSSKDKMSAAEMVAMVTFGLSELSSADEAAQFDVDAVVGETDENGHWQLPKPAEVKPSIEVEDDAAVVDDQTSIYFFEGKDYRDEVRQCDRDALQSLVESAQSMHVAGSPLGQRASVMGRVAPRKPKVPLTEEELAERQRKRDEAEARRKERKAEERQRRDDEKAARREALWRKNGYVSVNLAEPSGESAEAVAGALDVPTDEGPDDARDVVFLMGDVTQPQPRAEHAQTTVLVMHCVDDSGSWGRGGVFDALAQRSASLVRHYDAAARSHDLHLGDAHLVPLDEATPTAKSFGVLLVAQSRRQRDQMDMGALSTALRRVAEYARSATDECSVHVARIGYGMPSVRWYTVERLLKKHLTRNGIPTYVYYFPRRHAGAQKRAAASTSADSNPPAASKRLRSDHVGSAAAPSQPLTAMFDGLALRLLGFEGSEEASLGRLVVAFGGDVSSDIPAATHIVVGARRLTEEESQELADARCSASVVCVDADWLRASLKDGQLACVETHKLS